MVGNRYAVHFVPDYNKINVYNCIYRLLPKKFDHERKIYGLMGFIGDIGGVTEIVMLMFGFFVLPFSEFSFNLKAMKKLFLVRSSDQKMFHHCSDHELTTEFKVTRD